MPYNLALHEHLISLGYVHTHNEADFDDGDPENGPGTYGGHCAFDQYEGPDEYCFASEAGVLDRQARDLELEKWMAAECQL